MLKHKLLATNLKNFIRANDLSLRKVAHAVNCSATTVFRYLEDGDQPNFQCNANTLYNLSRLLGVSEDELLHADLFNDGYPVKPFVRENGETYNAPPVSPVAYTPPTFEAHDLLQACNDNLFSNHSIFEAVLDIKEHRYALFVKQTKERQFAFIVRGNFLAPRLYDGDIVVIEEITNPHSLPEGALVLAYISDPRNPERQTVAVRYIIQDEWEGPRVTTDVNDTSKSQAPLELIGRVVTSHRSYE